MAQPAATPAQQNRKLTLKQISYLIDYASQKRKFGKDWCYIYIRGVTEKSRVDVPGIMALMDAALRKDEAMLMENTVKNEVLILVGMSEDKVKGLINGSLYAKFAPTAIVASTYPLVEKGCEQLAKIFESSIPQNDFVAKLGYLRFSRKGNVFLVLDDDPMILKQMEHMLKPMGLVECAPMAEEFLHHYKRTAPNVVFIDIHLKTEKGTDLAGVLKSMLDPHAFIIIISSDTVKENIIETKAKGAQGFVGKPLNRDMVSRAVNMCPTLVPKK